MSRQRTPSNAVELKERLADQAASPAPTAGPTIRDLLAQHREQVRAALPRHLDIDRFMRLVLTECRTNTTLLQCSFPSLMACVMRAAQLGLEPGPLGHCYLLPFWNRKLGQTECTFILGYKGMIDLARRGGTIRSIEAREVCANDDFDFCYGLDERLVHKPKLSDRGEPIAFYGIARFADGGHTMLVLSKGDVDRRRARSKAADNGPWVTDYDAMARKTVIRAMAPFLPLTIEAATAIAEEREFIEGEETDLALPAAATNGHTTEDANERGAGAEGSAGGGEPGDGANGQDVGRSESEPAPDSEWDNPDEAEPGS